MLAKRIFASLLFVSFAFAATAEMSLDDAKAQGLVGEDASGYIAAVTPSPGQDVRNLIKSVNDQRRAEYERIAAANGIDVADVEKLAARKAIDKTEPGRYVRLPGSDWQRK